MPVYAGNIIYASDVNNVMGRQFEAPCTVATTVNAAAADVTGASITFTTTTANATVVAHFSADHIVSSASAGTISITFLSIDGVDDNARQGLLDMRTLTRVTVAQSYKFSLAAAGSHTIKLRCQKTAAAGTDQLQAGHTALVLNVYESV